MSVCASERVHMLYVHVCVCMPPIKIAVHPSLFCLEGLEWLSSALWRSMDYDIERLGKHYWIH